MGLSRLNRRFFSPYAKYNLPLVRFVHALTGLKTHFFLIREGTIC